ncbi:MAG: hypothetical protein H8D47_01750 [Planctomycetes bacterium]|nr:hypothetical protein [Planctomycetota bacterium]
MVRTFFVIAGVLFLLGIAGCQEQEVVGSKQGKLIQAENSGLKVDLAKCGQEIEGLNEQAAECEKEKTKIKSDMEKGVAEMIDFLIIENQKLTEENKALKAQLDAKVE